MPEYSVAGSNSGLILIRRYFEYIEKPQNLLFAVETDYLDRKSDSPYDICSRKCTTNKYSSRVRLSITLLFGVLQNRTKQKETRTTDLNVNFIPLDLKT